MFVHGFDITPNVIKEFEPSFMRMAIQEGGFHFNDELVLVIDPPKTSRMTFENKIFELVYLLGGIVT